MKEIMLSRGYIATVDDADYDRVSALKWHLHISKHYGLAKLYARHKSGGLTVYLHRFIMGADPSVEVDHRDGNGLNDTRGNLRIASSSQNKHNMILTRSNSSGFKGVAWQKRRGTWRAKIAIQGKEKYIGAFSDKVEAARAYDEAAKQLHGEFARTNASMGLLPEVGGTVQ